MLSLHLSWLVPKLHVTDTGGNTWLESQSALNTAQIVPTPGIFCLVNLYFKSAKNGGMLRKARFAFDGIEDQRLAAALALSI